MIDLLIVTVSE